VESFELALPMQIGEQPQYVAARFVVIAGNLPGTVETRVPARLERGEAA
jgi:hypothetical protein